MNLLNKLALTALCVSTIALPEVFKAQVGETITIKQYSNGSTGYSWYFLDPKTKEESFQPLLNEFDCVQFVNSYTDYEHNPKIGSGNFKYWKFKAVKPGITQFKMVYKQLWNPESASEAEDYIIEVVA